MSSERALWLWLKRRIPSHCHYSRIESESSPGFPDLHVTNNGISLTVELKCSRNPTAKYPFKVGGMRRDQIFWIKDEVAAGGIVWLFLQIGRKRYWVEGKWAAAVNNWTFPQIKKNAYTQSRYFRKQKP